MADPQVPKDTPPPAVSPTTVPPTTPEPAKSKARTVLDYFAPAGSLLPILAMVGGGFLAGQKWDETRANTMESCLKERRDFVESQLKVCTEKDEQNKQAVAILTTQLNNCKLSTKTETPPPHPSALPANEADIQVISGETAKVFSRELFVTLRAIQPSATAPPRYQAYAALGAPGQKSEDFHGDAGQSKQFAGFEIRITSVDAVTASFHIRKLDSQAPAH